MANADREVSDKIRANVPFMNLMRSKNDVVSILMSLWRIYKKHPSRAGGYLKKCKVQDKSDSKRWAFPKEIAKFRELKTPNLKYSQLYADRQTLLNKVDIFSRHITKYNIKNIILLGDDDLLSFLIAENFRKLHILVLDIDNKIVDFINNKAYKKGYNILAKKYDVRKPLPANLLKKADYFFFDSSHCLGGYVSFLIRSICSLKQNSYGGQFIIQLIDDKPVFTSIERKKLMKFIHECSFDIALLKKEAVIYEIPPELIYKFKKGLLHLFAEKPSKRKLEAFLVEFGFSEFLPGVSLLPEAIIEIMRSNDINYPPNTLIGNNFKKKCGPMYFYQHYGK